jgi:anaerobic magnesium-protoporphyrin IX monomethyl ester cyclase
MARTLLVNPPFYRLLGSHYNGLSLGLSYIASSINGIGHDAWVYNADFNPAPQYKTLHQIFDDFGREPLDFSVANPIIRECLDAIIAFKPDWIGYSAYTAVIPVLRTLTEEVEKLLPETQQVVGGSHATLDPDTERLIPAADFVVRGEGELVMRNLLAGWEPGTRTIQAPRITDLDGLPFPERTKLLPDVQHDTTYLSTARGCPWRCYYCASPQIWPRVYARSVESVVAESRIIRSQVHGQVAPSSNGSLRIADNAVLYIIDDTFTYNERRAVRIMRYLDMPWKCESRADTITDTLAATMAECGCVRTKVGVESGSDRILHAMNKGETKADIRRGIRLLQKYGVPVTIYLMAGFPGETDDDLRETIAFARELQPDYCSISLVAPYFGTQLYRDAVAAGVDVDAPWGVFFHHNNARLLNHDQSDDLIEELWSLCDIRKYA